MNQEGVRALSFEEIKVGQTARLERRITADLVDAFAQLTGDVNPLHMSDEFARSKKLSGRVAHGLLVGSIFSAIAGTMLPGRDCLLQEVRFEFVKPIYMDAVLDFEASVIQKVEAYRAIIVKILAKNPAGEIVIRGQFQAGVLP